MGVDVGVIRGAVSGGMASGRRFGVWRRRMIDEDRRGRSRKASGALVYHCL